MNDYLPFIVGGLATGSLYALAGLGLVLTFRTSGVFNFGHGAIAAAAAFTFNSLYVDHQMAWPMAMAITIVAFAVVGGVLMEFLTRTLTDTPAAVVVLVTVGIFLGVNGFLLVHFGAVTRQAPDFLPTTGFTLSGVNISWAQIIGALVALVGAFALNQFLANSRRGVAMRAVVDNPTLLALTGENPVRVRRSAWMIGSSFAALSGVLLAPTLGLDATLLTLLVVQAFGACAIGFFSDLRLTYLGGLVVGVLAALATKVFTTFPFNQMPPAVPFIVLIVVLLVAPISRLPRGRVSHRSLASTAASLDPKLGAVITAAGAAALLLVPRFAGTHLQSWISFTSSVVLFGSLALLVWTSGQISLCQISFAAIGATTMAHFTGNGVPWFVALLLTGVVTIPVGALVAIPAIRFSGIYLALITFGFGLFLLYVVYPSELMFGSGLSVESSRMEWGPIHASTSDTAQYYVSLAVAAVAIGGLVIISRSRFGRLLRGLAESPVMLGTLGLNVIVTRLILFSISAFYAGIAGAMMSSQYASSSVSFFPVLSLILVAILGITGIFGGRLIMTTIVSALLYSVMPSYIELDADHQTLYFGVMAIAAGIFVANRERIVSWIQGRAVAGRSRTANGPARARGTWRPALVDQLAAFERGRP